jgi:nucleotide-binding universal stress UspA family protein
MSGGILVGVDGRQRSNDALALALELAEARSAPLDVAAVLDYRPLPIDLNPYEVALREHFDAIFAAAAERTGERGMTTHALTGSSPAASLAELAERLDPELIVVGSTSRGPLGRVMPGDVGSSLLSGSACAVAVAPAGYGERQRAQPRSVGVGYDGGEEAERALEAGRRWAEAFGAGLRLIAVVPWSIPISEELADPIAPREAVRERLEREVRAAATRTPSARTEVEIVDGEQPSDALIARSEELDLLVVGSRGYGPLRRVFLGGVSSKVIRRAACPVIAVPRGSGTERAAGGDEQDA